MSIVNKVSFELSENLKFTSCSFFISLLTFSPFFVYHISLNRSIFYLSLFFFLFLLSFISKILFNILTIYINLSGLIILHTFLNWGTKSQILDPFLELIIYSNSNESIEYLQSYFGVNDLLILIYYLILTFFLLLFNQMKKTNIFYLKSLSILISTSILLTLHFLSMGSRRVPFYKVYPLGLITSIENTLNKTNQYLKRNEYLKNQFPTTDSLINKESKVLYDKVIIVLGESANKNYMGIYNNSHKTNPFFNSIKDSLILFNAISPATQTHISIPLMFTEVNYTNLDDFSKRKSLITDFKISGYQTFWISNQEGALSDFYGPVQSIAKESFYSYFRNIDYVLSNPDGEILNKVKEKIIPLHKQMFTIHLMGSHRNYDKRYPSEVSLYKPGKNLVEKYKNTIFYTDFILKNIFEMFNNKKEKVLIVYTSDHGETIDPETGGHGYFNPYRDSVDVPLIFFSNIENPRILEIKEINKKSVFNNENFFSIINYVSYLQNNYSYSCSKIIISQNVDNVSNYDKMKYK